MDKYLIFLPNRFRQDEMPGCFCFTPKEWTIDGVRVDPSEWAKQQFSNEGVPLTWPNLLAAVMVIGMMVTKTIEGNPFPLVDIKENPNEYCEKVSKAFLALSEEQQLEARRVGIGKMFQPNVESMSFDELMRALMGS